ncbi:lysoplasmalogenase family protein [Salaquimonas pukyongi]|uniref:lysoplasmalogenase family protein n=1 Tax=Salaquimonas pukyongi TaxID=2712698 RepID=UPI00096BC598|nr:lysoplasmalogenase family protein [Salaquimonas pukyongi]
MPDLAILIIIAASAIALIYGVFIIHRPENAFRSAAKTVPVALLTLAAFLAGLPVQVVLALAACAAGDWFLSLEGEPNFLLGLGAFLLGHLLYAAHFVSLISPDHLLTGDMALLALILLALIASVLFRLWPHLDGLKVPVVIYAFAIAAMAFTAKAADPGQIVLAGIALFMVSDIILAQEKFTPLTNTLIRRSMPYLVWFLYFAGQALIVYGMIG